MRRHSRRAAPALASLTEADPALAALSLWCAHRDSDGSDTRTVGDTIYYGSGFAALTGPEQVSLAAHHILHVAFRHAARAEALGARLGPGFDAGLFNIAADAIVNETLLLAGHVLPRPRVTLTALLEATGRPGEIAERAVAAWDVERLYTRLTGDEASGTGRNAEAARRLARAAGFEGDLDGGGSEPGQAGSASDWHGRLTRALAEGRRAGRGLGRLSGRLGDLPRSEIPWERLLRGAVTRAVTRDRLPQPFRPARRWLAMEADARMHGGPEPGFLPATGRPRADPRFAVLIDASGSVPPALKARFAGEVAGIAARTGAELHLVVFDSEVRESRRLPAHGMTAALREMQWPEGGGTDFGPAMAVARDADPAIIVVLTDLEADPGSPPGRIPVLWATPGPIETPPAWGRHIALDR